MSEVWWWKPLDSFGSRVAPDSVGFFSRYRGTSLFTVVAFFLTVQLSFECREFLARKYGHKLHVPNAAGMGPYGRDVETPKMGVFLIERPDEHCNSVASWSWSPTMATARHGDERRNVPVLPVKRA